MPQWMKKLLVTLIAIATLGTYMPTALLEIEAEESKSNLSDETDVNQDEASDHDGTFVVENNADPVATMHDQVRQQSMLKFGPRISEQVANEFTEVILPKMESVLETILLENEVHYLSITENPSGGYGERIFNVVDVRTEETIAKFHVRRDHRPLEGYYFNFHYHLNTDDFQTHYQLGEIFWDKNTPPKWMA